MAMLAEPRRKQKFSIDPRGTKWSDDNSKFGQKLLEKFGWQKGKGLGAKEDGKTDHVKVSVKSDLRGVGCTKNQADKWIAHQDDFNALLASLNQSNVEEGSNSDDAVDKVSSLEAKSKTSRARVHYQKFTKGKDLSAKSMQDLDCVFGVRKSKSDPSTPQCQSEENSDNDGEKDTEGEDNVGLKTIKSSDSVQEYFAKKMAALKKARSSGTGTADESQDKFDQPDDSTEDSITKANKKVTFSIDDGSSTESEKESKKAKKKKKRKTKDLDKETSESNDIVKKKSKKQKRKSESGENIDNDNEKNKAEVTIEKSRKKEKKRRNKEKSSDEIVVEAKNDEEQNYSIEENFNESNETIESEILMKKSKKKSKKEKTDKKKAALGNDDISDITENKKCKKYKISETVDNIEEESSAQKSKKKDKKKKNKGKVDENTCDIAEGKISDELEESGGSKKKKSKKRKSCEDPGNDGPTRDEKNDEPKKKRKKKSGEDVSSDMEMVEKKEGKAANECCESELNTDRNENSSAISKSSTVIETKFENSVSKQAEGDQDSKKEMNFHNTRSLDGRNAATHGHMNEWRGGNRWQAGYHSNRSKNAQDIFGKKGTNISEIKGYQLNNNTGFVKS